MHEAHLPPDCKWRGRKIEIFDFDDFERLYAVCACPACCTMPDEIEDPDQPDDLDEPYFEGLVGYKPQLRLAYHYARQGYPVLPCDPVTKRSLVPMEQASKNSITIENWWGRYHDAFARAVAFEQAEKSQPRSTLTFYDELDDDPPPKRWIIKGVLAHGETSNWFGPPGSLKSALMTDLAIHAASGQDWRGFRASRPGEHCGVLYLALERGAQVKRRLSAYKIKRGAAADLPIAVKSEIIDLMRADCVDLIIGTVREVEAHFRCNVGLIIVDTISKGIAAGGGDEDRAKDTNAMLANLRRVEERSGVHIACVGHTGKDEAKGHRGSSAHMGDVDLMVQISGDAVKTATIIKANDQEEGPLTTWTTEVVSLGTDADGDEITTALISNETPATGKQTKAKRRLTDSQSRAMECLIRCVNDHGRPPPPSNEFPQNVRVVSLSEWRTMCERGGLSSAEKKEDRDRAFRRAKDELQTLHQIGCLDDFVWKVPSQFDFNGA